MVKFVICGYLSNRADRIIDRRNRGLLCLSKLSLLSDGSVGRGWRKDGRSADTTRNRRAIVGLLSSLRTAEIPGSVLQLLNQDVML